MRYFLAKTDPDTYSISDFEKDQVTTWDGVHNYAALLVIKAWCVGDRVYIYHSQGEKAIVGLAEVAGEPYKDPHDVRGISWVAKLKHLQTYPVDQRVTLKDIKDSGLFADFALVTQSRLSTMACPESFVRWMRERGFKDVDES